MKRNNTLQQQQLIYLRHHQFTRKMVENYSEIYKNWNFSVFFTQNFDEMFIIFCKPSF